ncbi:hypothetical protein MMC29_006317 [Sticta canariensis]|nr:hypothetical protein [Sticta canariensis]
MYNEKFSKELKSRKCISFLENLDDDYKRALLLVAKAYEWFNPGAPEYYDFSLPCIMQLSSESWPMEQRAYILHFQARGITAKKIHEKFNEQYRPQRSLGAVNHELTFLNSKPELAKLLRNEFPKFSWWERDPVKGEKEWAAMNRRSMKVEAYARKKAHESRFKGFEEEAEAAAAREEEVEDIFAGEDEGEFSFSSPPPLQPPSPMHSSSSSSRHPQKSSESLRTPSASSFLRSSPSSEAPLTPNPASASSALAFSNPAGDYSDNDYEDESYYEEEEDDAFSKPFHSPDTPTPSFPNLNPMSDRVRGPPLSFGAPLPSSSSLSPPTGGIPSASPTTSSPTYLFPPRNPPFNSARELAQSSTGHPRGAFDNYSQRYNYYNPGHPNRSFGSFSHHDPPASLSSTPYLPGLLPTPSSASFSLGAPPQPRRPAQSNPSGPPPPASSSSDPNPQRKEAGAET